MIKRRLAVVISVVAVTTSCANMNQDQCQMANWQALGYQQGANGRDTSQFNSYQLNCAKHQVKADFSAFKTGYNQGLQRYCTFEQGLDAGKNAHNYNNHCTRQLFPEFAEGYAAGLIKYCSYDRGFNSATAAKQRQTVCAHQEYPEYNQGYSDGMHTQYLIQTIENLKAELNATTNAIAETTQKITATEALIISAASTPSQRKQALQSIRNHKKQEKSLRSKHQHIKAKLSDEQEKLNQI